MFPMRRLDIYLNDHLAGATLGVELSRRAAREHRGTEVGACFLSRVARLMVPSRNLIAAGEGTHHGDEAGNSHRRDHGWSAFQAVPMAGNFAVR